MKTCIDAYRRAWQLFRGAQPVDVDEQELVEVFDEIHRAWHDFVNVMAENKLALLCIFVFPLWLSLFCIAKMLG